jgi:ribonuclease HI
MFLDEDLAQILEVVVRDVVWEELERFRLRQQVHTFRPLATALVDSVVRIAVAAAVQSSLRIWKEESDAPFNHAEVTLAAMETTDLEAGWQEEASFGGQVLNHPANEDSGRRTVSGLFDEASSQGRLVKDGRTVEQCRPQRRQSLTWLPLPAPVEGTCYAWTDGSYRNSAGAGWLISADPEGASPALASGSKVLGAHQTSFDAEITAIELVVRHWESAPGMRRFQRMIIHSDSTSAITRMTHTGAGRGQATAIRVRESLLATFARDSRAVGIQWVKGHSGVPGNERADQLAGRAAEKGVGPGRFPWPSKSQKCTTPARRPKKTVIQGRW